MNQVKRGDSQRDQTNGWQWLPTQVATWVHRHLKRYDGSLLRRLEINSTSRLDDGGHPREVLHQQASPMWSMWPLRGPNLRTQLPEGAHSGLTKTNRNRGPPGHMPDLGDGVPTPMQLVYLRALRCSIQVKTKY